MEDVSTAVQTVILVLVVAVAAGSVVGQPVGLAYVEGDSMEPTLERGDAFVALPSFLTDVGEGDVVVFETDEGLTTHRVVDTTEEGYVTKGDANPFTDQEDGTTPVRDEMIAAEALQVGGGVVVVPGLGTVAERASAVFGAVEATVLSAVDSEPSDSSVLAYVLLFLSVAGYLYETVSRGSRRETGGNDRRRAGRSHDGYRVLRLIAVVAVVLAVLVTATASSGSQTLDVVGSEFGSESPFVVETGETKQLPYSVSHRGVVPVVAYLDSPDEAVSFEPKAVRVGGDEKAEVTVGVTAPDETGHYQMTVTEHRYLHVLPVAVLEVLHRTHPWLAHAGVAFVLGGATYLLSLVVLGSGRTNRRQQNRETRGTRR